MYTLVPIVTIGHETVMGKVLFFGSQSPPKEEFDFETEYPFMEELLDTKLQVSLYNNRYLNVTIFYVYLIL